ncbi:MAG: MFS transporter [Candidatus Doudnabacteria bacterium]|nr:MFS transporter [Candidatus Doudnabacteria bacterium]
MHRNLKLMKWFNFFLSFKPYNPIAIVYFAQVTKSYALALLVFSIFSISTCIFEIPTGIYSDRIGRKKTLMFGVLASILCVAFYAIGGSFWFLAIGAIFAGLSDSLFSGNNDSLIYDTLAETNEQKTLDEHLGKINAMIPLGLGTSAIIATFVFGFSLSWIFWFSIVPLAIALVIGFQLVEPKIQRAANSGNVYSHLRESFIAFKQNNKLRDLSLSSILNFGMGEVENQFMPAFISTVWPVWALGISKAMNNLFTFLGSHQAGPILKKFFSFKVLIVGQVIGMAVTVLAVLYSGVWSPILIALTSIAFGVTSIALNALMHREFSNQQRATMGSINSFFGNIFFAIFAYLFGLVADRLGVKGPIIITETLSLSVVYLYWRLFKNYQKEVVKNYD